ncbi:serine/threonine-protein phosphatase 2A regulatory subunit B'' subunit beta isoform X1 [Histomonas meleagridis]|uniref:serine/threonine-protein phosphatase 2A regulatory subunit B'' subunit beta isoform X1 n=1 Tax=Histomonas meleagridis TaxID=135588 RepID=UPI00355A992F|nr:serine/threonine-protein phosphatase 2A regulatory subunit B'' subunit beta isoform X1 [Histomonas meleagridis]KAH0796425.1 serine/threonine-protein phosphatase 2A regulatory subunit B'' subunit beta isoform X1 [Histomonas meleagridis]
MEVDYGIQFDECFAGWLTDPFNQPIFDAIRKAADDLDKGIEVNFDFSVFEQTAKNANLQKRRVPALRQSSPSRGLLEPNTKKESTASTEFLASLVGEKIATFYGPKESNEEKTAAESLKSPNEKELGLFLQRHCRLPKCFAPLLLKTHDFSGDKFQKFWKDNLYGRDPNERFFRLVRKKNRNYVVPNDLAPFVRTIVETHKSLEFLLDEELFLEKFIDFIVTRCFYIMDTELRGTVSLQQFRKMDIAGVFYNAERMQDVNDSHHIFNYQHFYVAFCKFWDLDADSDSYISKSDLMKFNDSSISPIIIERFVDAKFFPLTANPKKGYVDFTSFVYFLMSTEDKSNLTSINFWYKICDLDDDGLLSIKEVEQLYSVQYERMRITGNETIPFSDILRQLIDVVNAGVKENTSYVAVHDLEKSKMADVFFNTLFDLQKFLVREYQFPVINSNDEVTKNLTPWELYVLIEYDQLVNDDE